MTQPADAAQQADIAAGLLAQGRSIDALSRLCSAMAFAGLVLGAAANVSIVLITGLALSLVAGLAEAHLALRVGFDARLFRRLANGNGGGSIDLDAFDRAMIQSGLLPMAKAGRPLAERIMGAKRLLLRQALAAAAQIAIGAGAAVLARVLA